MRICVIGAGVIGLTTAYQLQNEGHDVLILDAEREPGAGASQGNGAQLSYSYVAPLADGSIPAKIPGLLWAQDSPLRFSLRADPAQWAWLASFLAACNARSAQATTSALLSLAALSRQVIEPWIESGLACDFERAGKLVLYPDQASLAAARRQVEFQARLGCEQSVLDVDECLAREPALLAYARSFVGGVWTASDAAADCQRFCVALADRLIEQGAELQLGQRVIGWRQSRGRIAVALTERGEFAADAFVIATGADSPQLTAPLGIRLLIQPLKGYSITLPAGLGAPRVSITDLRRKVVFAPLADASGARRLRVAGFVEIGAAPGIPAQRIQALRDAARDVVGLDASEADVSPWAGWRPATPGGRPVIGATRIANLFLNVGHGTLGWTLAAGSAQLLAALIAGRAAPLDATPFASAA